MICEKFGKLSQKFSVKQKIKNIKIILNNNHNDNNNLIISGQTLGFLLTIDLLVSDNGIPKFSYPTSK